MNEDTTSYTTTKITEGALFPVGTRVAWESQAGGRKTRKEGVVKTIIGTHTHPKKIFEPGSKVWSDLKLNGVSDKPRGRLSYVIRVESGKRVKYYWPLTSNLEVIRYAGLPDRACN